MTKQITALIKSAKNFADQEVEGQEYTLTKILVESMCPTYAAAKALMRDMRDNGANDPLGWFYDTFHDFPYDIRPCKRESRLLDVMFKTKKTTPWKMFKDLLLSVDRVAVVFKPTDYPVFVVMHNYENKNEVCMDSDDWWSLEMRRKGVLITLQPLMSFIGVHKEQSK